jgi:hypothetical protein
MGNLAIAVQAALRLQFNSCARLLERAARRFRSIGIESDRSPRGPNSSTLAGRDEAALPAR